MLACVDGCAKSGKFPARQPTHGHTEAMGKLNPKGLKALLKKPPRRYPDGDGLFFKVAGQGKAYWTYRYTVGGKETETSLGPFPEMSLDEAQIKHLELRAAVRKKIDPLRDKHAAKAAVIDNTGTPTFGECADAFLKAHDPSWRNPKHAQQWAMTLTKYCASIRATPVDQVDANAVRRVLEPIWTKTPETASRLRGRIEAVLAAAQVAGHIDADRPNPARWKGWLDHMLPQPKKLGSRGHHAALAYDQLPGFMAKLGDMPGVASRALMFTVLTACRTGECSTCRGTRSTSTPHVDHPQGADEDGARAHGAAQRSRARDPARPKGRAPQKPVRVPRQAAASVIQHEHGDAFAPDGHRRHGAWDARSVPHVGRRSRRRLRGR
jgi:ferredoxin